MRQSLQYAIALALCFFHFTAQSVVDTLIFVSYYPFRGVETSIKETDYTNPVSVGFFVPVVLSTKPTIDLSTELCWEGDEYNTLRGNKSAAIFLEPFRTSQRQI